VTTCPGCGAESPEGFSFCPSCGAALAEARPAREVRKTVTVLFCDVVGSTALGERVDPEPLRRLMGSYYEQMRAIVERHGGTVEKFIGDAIVAVFGVPVAHEDDPERAARAALRIIRVVGGWVLDARATSVQVQYKDGTHDTTPLLYVSKPIDAGFFIFGVPSEHLTATARVKSVVALDKDGHVLARESAPPSHRRPAIPAHSSYGLK